MSYQACKIIIHYDKFKIGFNGPHGSKVYKLGLSWATPDFQLGFKFQLQMVGKVVARGLVS